MSEFRERAALSCSAHTLCDRLDPGSGNECGCGRPERKSDECTHEEKRGRKINDIVFQFPSSHSDGDGISEQQLSLAGVARFLLGESGKEVEDDQSAVTLFRRADFKELILYCSIYWVKVIDLKLKGAIGRSSAATRCHFDRRAKRFDSNVNSICHAVEKISCSNNSKLRDLSIMKSKFVFSDDLHT